jgi:hypothetical protein
MRQLLLTRKNHHLHHQAAGAAWLQSPMTGRNSFLLELALEGRKWRLIRTGLMNSLLRLPSTAFWSRWTVMLVLLPARFQSLVRTLAQPRRHLFYSHRNTTGTTRTTARQPFPRRKSIDDR